MFRTAIVAVLAASLPVAVSAPGVADAEVSVSAASRATYDTTVELLNRASRADQTARTIGGWTVRVTSAEPRAAQSSAQLACCDAVRRIVSRAAPGRTSTMTLAVDLRGGRYRALGSRESALVGTPYRVFTALQRTRLVRRAVVLANRRHARWISGSARDPIPAMAPGELYADSAAGSLPSSLIATMIGHPRNVKELERVPTSGGTAYRGTVRRFGAEYRVRATFAGDQLLAAAMHQAGTPILATTWTYERPVLRLPARPERVGARTLRAAYAYTALPRLTAAGAGHLRHKIARWRERPGITDDTIREYVQYVLQTLSLQIGPGGIVIAYGVRLNPNGGRIVASNRFGQRSRSITWDAAAQRLRVSPVR